MLEKVISNNINYDTIFHFNFPYFVSKINLQNLKK